MVLLKTISCIVLLLIVYCTAAGDKLILVQEMLRHGARHPFFPIKNSQLTIQAQKNHQLKELTPQGKHMCYALGKLLYKKYWKQLFAGTQYEKKYHSSLFEVWSTNINRTLTCAQAQLFGLLEDLQSQVLEQSQLPFSLPPFQHDHHSQQTAQTKFYVYGKNKYYHSVPIHTEPVLQQAGFEARFVNRAEKFGGNFLSLHTKESCPNQLKWRKQNLRSTEYQLIQKSKKITDFFAELSKQLQYPVNYDTHGVSIPDSLEVANHLGVPFLKTFENPDNVKIGEFTKITHQLLAFYTQVQRKTAFTLFLRTLTENIKRTINFGRPKFVMFSVHDSTLLNVLSSLQMTNIGCILANFFQNVHNQQDCITVTPPYCSTIILQLWKRDLTSQYFIKILYNGYPRKIPICSGKIECPLEQFEQWANRFQLEDPKGMCGIPEVTIEY